MIGAVTGAAKAVGSVAGVVGSIFGGGSKVGSMWDRKQPITTSETLTQGGNKVDTAYQTKINAQWRSDLNKANGWAGVNAANVVWAPYGANAETVYNAARAAQGVVTASGTGAGSVSLAGMAATIKNPMFIGMLVVIVVGAYFLTRKAGRT